MTKEEKQLLIKDLCARLPYGIIVHVHDINVDDYDRRLIGEDLDFIELDRKNCKPYLRPMENMTEEEYENLCNSCTWLWFKDDLRTVTHADHKCYDWLNAHHFDYRGLIPIGLALEAPEGMYKTE